MANTPLAVQLRPKQLSEVVGQDHLVGPEGVITKMARKNKLQNILLWGPPGTGKTSIAHALATETDNHFRKLDATRAGVKELRQVIQFAEKCPEGEEVVLAVDECHRWSKNVQDTLLAAVENGTIVLVGLTVETARFAVIKALLSRCLILETKPLDDAAKVQLYKRVRQYYKDQGRSVSISNETVKRLIVRSSGDARKIIQVLETLIEIMADDDVVKDEYLDLVMPHKHLYCDATGSERYDLAHCYQEAIQNSDADAAIYWLAKWIESGEDPAYICRRMLITAAEDCCGNPSAMTTAMAACYSTERTGLPESMIPMALATCEMAMSKRNKVAYKAIKEAIQDVKENKTIHVPPGLRAGTSGYVAAVSKKYVKGWRRDREDDSAELPCASPDESEKWDEILYAIGDPESGDHGMTHGPTPSLGQMLDTYGYDGAVIIRFVDGCGWDVICRWDSAAECWTKETGGDL